jgi:hypothetical protein
VKSSFVEEFKYVTRVRNFKRIPAHPINEISPQGHSSPSMAFEYLKRPAAQQAANQSGSVEAEKG